MPHRAVYRPTVSTSEKSIEPVPISFVPTPVISFETAVSWQQFLLFLLLAVTANFPWNALRFAAAAANPAVLEMSSVLLPVIGFSVMAAH